MKRVIYIYIILITSSFSAQTVKFKPVQNKNHFWITGDYVKIFSEPTFNSKSFSIDFGEKITVLKFGTVFVKKFSHLDNWVQIKWKNHIGWTNKNNISEYKEMFVAAQSGLKVRDNHSLNGKKIGFLKFKSVIKVIDEYEPKETISGLTGKWEKIRYNNKTGWVFGAYLQRKLPLLLQNLKCNKTHETFFCDLKKEPIKLNWYQAKIFCEKWGYHLLQTTNIYFIGTFWTSKESFENKNNAQAIEIIQDSCGGGGTEIYNMNKKNKNFVLCQE